MHNMAEYESYLDDIFKLYNRILEFDDIELEYDYGSVENNHHCYIHEDIDTVLNSFSRIFSVPPEQLESIKDGMRSGIIDFTLLPQGEVASFSVPLASEELQSLLYVLSRNYFKSVRKSLNIDNIYWKEGKCPVCNAIPSISMIEEGDKRKYCCSFCATVGYYKRIGCPNCLSEDPKLVDIIYIENDNHVRIDACTNCKMYIKTLNTYKAFPHDIDEADLLSLPLDIVAQRKGYIRKSPNPIGILTMV